MEAFACVGECVFLAACPKVLAAFFPISFSAQYFYSCNMLVSMAFFVEKNLAVLHVCVFFFSDYPPTVISSGLQMSLRLLEHFLHVLSPSHGLSLSFEEQALSISDILFSQGKDIVLCPIPNQTHVCFLSVTFLSPKVITMHHSPPGFLFSFFLKKIKKIKIFHGSSAAQNCNILSFTQKMQCEKNR